jgi:hypothetical protein
VQPHSPEHVPVSQQPQSQAAQHAAPQGQASAVAPVATKADNTINIRKYMAILEETGLKNRNRKGPDRSAPISSAKRSRGCEEPGLSELLQKTSTFPVGLAELDPRMRPRLHASRLGRRFAHAAAGRSAVNPNGGLRSHRSRARTPLRRSRHGFRPMNNNQNQPQRPTRIDERRSQLAVRPACRPRPALATPPEGGRASCEWRATCSMPQGRLNIESIRLVCPLVNVSVWCCHVRSLPKSIWNAYLRCACRRI